MIKAFQTKLSLLSPNKKARPKKAEPVACAQRDPGAALSDVSSAASSFGTSPGSSFTTASTQATSIKSAVSLDTPPANDARTTWLIDAQRAKKPARHSHAPVLFDLDRPEIFPFAVKIPFKPTPEALKANLWPSLLRGTDGSAWLMSNWVQKGSFGTFHVALDVATGMRAGIKKFVCDPALGNHTVSPTSHEEVLHEISMLDHLSRTPVLGVLENRFKPKVYMVMHYKDGDAFDLADALVGANPELRRAVGRTALRDLSHGLRDLHAQGFVHGDIKPENALYEPRVGISLADFGTVSAIAADGLVPRLMRTTTYIAPEMFSALRVSPAKDLWALGLFVMQMYSATSSTELFQKEVELPVLHANLEAFASWRDAVIRNDDSSLSLEDRRTVRAFAIDFAAFNRVDQTVAKYVLKHLLNPDPKTRATAASAAKFIDMVLTLDPGAQKLADAALTQLAQKAPNAHTLQLLRTYLPAARDLMRAAEAGLDSEGDLSFAA